MEKQNEAKLTIHSRHGLQCRGTGYEPHTLEARQRLVKKGYSIAVERIGNQSRLHFYDPDCVQCRVSAVPLLMIILRQRENGGFPKLTDLMDGD